MQTPHDAHAHSPVWRSVAQWARPATYGLSQRATIRLFAAGIGSIAGVAVASGVVWWCVNGFLAGDTLVYWFAGHRILIGHELYSMRPDDLWIPLVDPRPHGLYSPPLIAVPWILLASTPGNAGMILWWLAMAFCAVWAIAALLIGTRGWAGILILPLMPAFTLLIGVGNVDAAMLAGVVLSWMLTATGQDRAAGFLVGLMVSLKLTPAVLVVWLVATRRWQALAAAAVTGLILAGLVAVSLGPGILADYLGVVFSVSASGRTWALAIVAAGLLGVLLLGSQHERLGFSLAIVMIPLGSPVAAIHSWALLAGAAAPWTRQPYFRGGQRSSQDSVSTTSPGADQGS